MNAPALSVVIPTHNPRQSSLRRTLTGLRAQTFDASQWETIIVDNASTPALTATEIIDVAPAGFRIVREPTLGLTSARLRAFAEAAGDILVLVDDDNVLDPSYLETVAAAFRRDPRLGALGGRSIPEFEREPEPWVAEFHGLLALRDFGDLPRAAAWCPGEPRRYPAVAPIGAGMALRRACAEHYAGLVARDPLRRALDRTGTQLMSGGDNDLVMTILEEGHSVGYDPTLKLTHLIPAGRCTARYLARLHEAMQQSWMRVLSAHDANPWPPIARWTVPVRIAKAWFAYRAWSGPAARVRWRGACGHFRGRIPS